MSAKYMAIIRSMPEEEKPEVVKKKNYVVFRHKATTQNFPDYSPETSNNHSEQSSSETDSSDSDSKKKEQFVKAKTFLTKLLPDKPETKENIKFKSVKQRRKPPRSSKRESFQELPESNSTLKMYLPRRPGGFFKGILIFSIVLMLVIIFTNTNETIALRNMTIVTSLPNIFDPNILLNKKSERITDLMGDNEFVLIRENMTTILSHHIFFREAVPRSNITSNGFTVVLLHDKHTEATGGTGCCSGLWLWLGTLHRLGREGFHVIAIDLPGFGFSEGIQLDIRESAPFMKELIDLFKLNKVILISPSTSIKVSLPFANSNPELLNGLVIPSPTLALKYTNEANMERLETPTLITFGDEDKNALSDYEKVLCKIPNHELIKIGSRTVDDGVKLVYLDDPSHFHDNVVLFSKTLNH